jgi:hypothetical protein
MLKHDRHTARACYLVLAGALLLAGCDRGPRLAAVGGTITLDGQPLAGAAVEFQPDQGGSPSYGKTDGAGCYDLKFCVGRSGAMIGRHVVRISTFRQEAGSNEIPVNIPERVPPRYNEKSELVCEVQAGRNRLDFTLEGALGGGRENEENIGKR